MVCYGCQGFRCNRATTSERQPGGWVAEHASFPKSKHCPRLKVNDPVFCRAVPPHTRGLACSGWSPWLSCDDRCLQFNPFPPPIHIRLSWLGLDSNPFPLLLFIFSPFIFSSFPPSSFHLFSRRAFRCGMPPASSTSMATRPLAGSTSSRRPTPRCPLPRQPPAFSAQRFRAGTGQGS